MRLLVLSAALLLTACASPELNQANIEAQAWSVLAERATAECGGRAKDINKGQAVKAVNCVNKISDEVVAPVVLYPDAFYNYRKQTVKDAKDFDKGVLSKEEWLANGQALWANYQAVLNNRVDAAQERDRQALSEALGGMNFTPNPQQPIPTFQPSAPTTTQSSCYMIGNQMNCTTY